MALLLAEAAKLSTDTLRAGVIETIIKDSPILRLLPFMDIVGNSLKYNRENTLPSVAFYAVGDTWAESAPDFSQETASLSIMGGDADVDAYLQQTRSNVNDIQREVIELKAKSMRHKFEDTFINGDTGTDPNAFDGVDKLAVAGQTVTITANGGPLTLRKLDELIDKVLGGKPQMLLMSRRSRRDLTHLMRTSGGLQVEKDEFGAWVELHNGIPVHVNDWIADDKTVGTSTDCSTIYAFQLSEDGVCGLHNLGIQVETVGKVADKDAVRTRIKWYCSLALFSTVKLAKLIGVRPVV